MVDKATIENHSRFLFDVVFTGLENRNTGFDSSLICHVSPEDFLEVIDRCERLEIEIYGIEVFSGVELLKVEICPSNDFAWARRLTGKYVDREDVTVCATFSGPGKRRRNHTQFRDLEDLL